MSDELQAIRTIRKAMLERKLRRKAAVEGMLLLAGVSAAFVWAPSLEKALLYTLAAAGIGIPLYVARRGADLHLLALADEWRTRAIEGRSATLAEWHAGAELPPWNKRLRANVVRALVDRRKGDDRRQDPSRHA